MRQIISNFITVLIVLVICGCSGQPKQGSRAAKLKLPQSGNEAATNISVQKGINPFNETVLNSDVVVLSDIHKLPLSDSPKQTYSEELMENLISSLASIESPDLGLSPSTSGYAFLPLEGKTHIDAFQFTNHNIKSSAALKEIVKLGPAALRYLLRHLNDTTPTKLKIEHNEYFGGMWFANELSGNPLGQFEQSILQGRPQHQMDPLSAEHIQSYTVKIGDVCFVAIGQITGRGYQAVRYQPTACIVLNSPTHDTGLCSQVRAIWTSENPRQKLFNSFLFDYSTHGKFNGESLDGWDIGSSFQIKSAMRLLFYFPNESAAMIANRLERLDVRPTNDYTFIKREVNNGVRTNDFITAVMWSPHPLIAAAIKNIANRTNDEEIIKIIQSVR